MIYHHGWDLDSTVKSEDQAPNPADSQPPKKFHVNASAKKIMNANGTVFTLWIHTGT
jgi:hypothetical protein